MADERPNRTEAACTGGGTKPLTTASNNNDSCENTVLTEKAARTVKEADVLLVVTGSGFSADSGLAVYNDIGKIDAYQVMGLDYSDISQPKWIQQDPGLFYGFWLQCFNDYRSTKPHIGYQILKRWRDDKNVKDALSSTNIAEEIRSRIMKKYHLRRPFDDDETRDLTPYRVDHNDISQIAGAFYAFTSNVDGHHYDVFGTHEINECHGNVELWQCTDRQCESGLWRAPVDHEFVVDKDTMVAPEFVNYRLTTNEEGDIAAKRRTSTSNDNEDDTADTEPARVGHIKAGPEKRSDLLRHMPPGLDQEGWSMSGQANDGDKAECVKGNWPRCGHCGSLARPSILMFGDVGCKGDLAQHKRWELWREAVMDLVKAHSSCESLKVCIIEIGCGMNVQTGRATSEGFLEEVLKKGGNPTLIRINPDFPEGTENSVARDFTVSIRSRGLDTIQQIDAIYKSMK